MSIRAAQLTDLGRIDQLYHDGLQLALQGEGATHPIRLWQILTRTLSAMLPLATASEMLFVLEDEDRMLGFIQGEVLSGSGRGDEAREAVRVLNLSLDPELPGAAGGPLIDHLCNAALERGVTRTYVRLPEGHSVAESFKAQDFQQYATERVFLLHDGGSLQPGPAPAGVRPARRKDLLGLFALYLAATPKTVSQVEAPDFGDWRAVYETEFLGRFGRRSVPSLVVERGGEVAGWLGLEPAAAGRPHTAWMLARPDLSPGGELQKEFLGEVARRLGSGGGPIWCNVRSYDMLTTRVLQDAGFEPLAGQELLVREMRARVRVAVRKTRKEKALAPAFG